MSKTSFEAAGRADSPPGTAVPVTFDEIYAQHFPFVWRCLRSLGVVEAALDDAAQDVFVIVHRNRAEFRAESSLRTWLFGITRNVAANHRRTVRRKSAHAVPLSDELPQGGPGPHESAQDRQAAAFVARFLDGLDEPKRALFVLAVLEETSVPEVAGALEIPLNTAYSRLRRVREAFERALVARQEDSP